MQPVSPEDFDRLVADALDRLPGELVAALSNVVVVTADQHPDEPDLLGLYEGIPLTERADYFAALPDRISLYRIPLCRLAADRDQLVAEIDVTVAHEFGHHVGISEDRLDELGWS